MNIRLIQSERGVTLIELLVVLALTSLLLVFAISGVLFVQQFIDRWRRSDRVAEQVAFLSGVLKTEISDSHRMNSYPDSLVFERPGGRVHVFRRTRLGLFRDGHPLVSPGLRLDSLTIERFSLPAKSADSIFNENQHGDIMGIYRLTICVSGPQDADTFTTLVRNDHVYHKYAP